MSFKIDVFTYQGGSANAVVPPDIYERGVGGAELSLMTWAGIMAGRGHEVRIYNDPRVPGDYDGVVYLNRTFFNPGDKRDAFIAWRSPTHHLPTVKNCLKIHWSCDQHTMGDYAKDIVPYVDLIVCISPHHEEYYTKRYGPKWEQIGHLDLGVKLEDYDLEPPPLKIPNRFIFCSVPQRGLTIVRQIWPTIKEARPDASLVITSDYTLWGSPVAGDQEFRLDFVRAPGVEYLGNIPRARLVEEQLKAEVHLYPCSYDELFCISAAECQVAGAYPITSDMGALPTTNEFGSVFANFSDSPKWKGAYTQAVLSTIEHIGPDARVEMTRRARARFAWKIICNKWERLIEAGSWGAVR